MPKVILAKSTKIGGKMTPAGSEVEVDAKTKEDFIERGIVADPKTAIVAGKEVSATIEKLTTELAKANEAVKVAKDEVTKANAATQEAKAESAPADLETIAKLEAMITESISTRKKPEGWDEYLAAKGADSKDSDLLGKKE